MYIYIDAMTHFSWVEKAFDVHKLFVCKQSTHQNPKASHLMNTRNQQFKNWHVCYKRTKTFPTIEIKALEFHA
jgi:hypothetical protein